MLKILWQDRTHFTPFFLADTDFVEQRPFKGPIADDNCMLKLMLELSFQPSRKYHESTMGISWLTSTLILALHTPSAFWLCSGHDICVVIAFAHQPTSSDCCLDPSSKGGFLYWCLPHTPRLSHASFSDSKEIDVFFNRFNGPNSGES